MRAPRVVLVLLAGAIVGLGGGRAFSEDPLDTLRRTVETDASEKARIAAVVALGRLRDPRAFAPLARALGDRSPVVRGVAASALGNLGDQRARPLLAHALGDVDENVRWHARAALDRLRAPRRRSKPPVRRPTKATIIPRERPRRPLRVVVNAMANRSPAARRLTGRMRDLVASQLAGEPGVAVDLEGQGEFVVDGAITRLTRQTRGRWVEVTCEVKITVSSASGSLLSIVSGGATVQTARGSFRRSLEPKLQLEALDNALRGVHANLVGFLARRGAAR